MTTGKLPVVSPETLSLILDERLAVSDAKDYLTKITYRLKEENPQILILMHALTYTWGDKEVAGYTLAMFTMYRVLETQAEIDAKN